MNGVASAINSPVSLYIHLPWCLHKCAYCDFNSHATQLNEFPEDVYLERLISDLSQSVSLIQARKVQSIFIGGGTPSLFTPESIYKILSACHQFTDVSQACEITLETNPGTFEYQKFSEFLAAGVNRISIGVQSFNNRYLKVLERVHDRQQAIAAIETANQIGFENINADLMFGLPEQAIDHAAEDVMMACRLPLTHVSYYQLTLEPNTLYHRFPPTLPDEDTNWAIQNQGEEILTKHGFEQYEVSAYALNNMQSLHNTNYWQFGDYLGVGAGAHSKLTTHEGIIRHQRTRQPNSYIQAVALGTHIVQQHQVDTASLIFEFMLNNLRLTKGFSRENFTYFTGLNWPLVEAKIQSLLDEELLEQSDGMYRASTRGYQLLDELTQRFLP